MLRHKWHYATFNYWQTMMRINQKLVSTCYFVSHTEYKLFDQLLFVTYSIISNFLRFIQLVTSCNGIKNLPKMADSSQI